MTNVPSTWLAPILIFFWAFNWPASQMALDVIPPITFRFATLVGGSAFLFLLSVNSKDKCAVPDKAWPKLILLSLLNVGIFNVLSAYSISVLEGGRAAILAFTMPVWAMLIETALGYRATASRAVSLILGLAGLSAILFSIVEDPSFDSKAAVLMCSAAFSWAVGAVWMSRSPIAGLGARPVAMWMMLISALFVLLLKPIQEEPFLSLPSSFSSWFGLTFATVVGMGLCQSLWFLLLGKIGSVRGSFLLFAIPPMGVFLSWGFMDANVSPIDLLALTLLLLAAVSSIIIDAQKNQQKCAQPVWDPGESNP